MSHFTPNNTFSELYDKYNLVETLFTGTSAMRSAGQTYLPKEPAEATSNYNSRLNRSVLFPTYSKTIKTAVGKAFSRPVNIELPTSLDFLKYNVDGSGSTMERFVKDLTQDAINYGITYLLVDYPVLDPNSTLADERAAGALPYWVNIKPTQVLEISASYLDGLLQLTYFRFNEVVEDTDNLENNESIEQVKEFILLEDRSVQYVIYRKDKQGKEYIYDTNIIRGIDLIPIIPVYGNKTIPFHGSPVLMDLAQLNVTHWQMYSDYLNIVHATSVPMLVIKGYTEQTNPDGSVQELVISPNSAIKLTDPTGDVKWVEINGSGITAAKEALNDLEAKMSLNGLELTASANNIASETATGRLIDAATANSILKTICMDVEVAVLQAILYSAIYIDAPVEPTSIEVTINSTFLVDKMYSDIVELYKNGLLTQEEALAEIKSRGLLKSQD